MPFSSSIAGNYAFGKNAVTNISNPVYDIYYNNVSLLLHMNELDGSLNFIDSSPRTKPVIANGAAQISTAQSKFGGSSGVFDNTTAFLTSANNSDFDLSTGDWTIELFCRILPIQSDILINKASGFGYYGFQLKVQSSKFVVQGYNNMIIPVLSYSVGAAGPTISPDTWYHVAAARQNSNFYLYVNGALVDSSTSSATLYNSSGPLSIAGTSNGQALTSGYFDEVRLTKGVCRYPNGVGFNVPTAEFPNS